MYLVSVELIFVFSTAVPISITLERQKLKNKVELSTIVTSQMGYMRIDCVYGRTQGSQETELRLKVKAVVGYLLYQKSILSQTSKKERVYTECI